MNSNSLIPTGAYIRSEDLRFAYNQLQFAVADVNAAAEVLKQVRSTLCESPEYVAAPPASSFTYASDVRYLTAFHVGSKKRERDKRRVIYFAAYLRVVKCQKLLEAAINKMAEVVTEYRKEVDADRAASIDKECAMANCAIVDIELFDARHVARVARRDVTWFPVADGDFEAVDYCPRTICVVPGVPVDLHKLLVREYKAGERQYVTLSGAWGKNDAPPEDPKGPLLNRDEACEEAQQWIGLADTIGGSAEIYNVQTKQVEQPSFIWRADD